MFSISIAVGNVNWRLLFKTESTVKLAYGIIRHAQDTKTITPVEDDFGQTFTGVPQAILLEDMDKTKLVAVELALHDARVRTAATQAAMGDPQLRAAAAGRGPSVIQPGIGNGGFRG